LRIGGISNIEQGILNDEGNAIPFLGSSIFLSSRSSLAVMTLTSRLSAFFLAALGLVLVAFSAVLFFLARTYLYQQTQDRLQSTLNMLVAAAEIGPDAVEWEPQERVIPLSKERPVDPVLWLVEDEQGQRVDGSEEPADGNPLSSADLSAGPALQTNEIRWQGQLWRIAQSRVYPNGSTDAGISLRREEVPEGRKYKLLTMTVGLSLEPVRAKLRGLAGILTGVSSGFWLLALFVGRSFCRRALLPVNRMAATARSMGATDLAERLPVSPTKDELEDLGRAFNGLLDRVQESFERQRRFTGDASHQLRTPLTAMMGQVEVVLRRDRSPEEYQRVLALVQDRSMHLRQIVEMLLFLARADAESNPPQLETIELATWLRVHLQSWSGNPRAPDLRLEVAEDGLLVRVQTPLLGQLVDNLLDNASKFSEPGSPITVRAWRDHEEICLGIEDRGAGIAPDDLAHIFKPFYQSAYGRSRGLTGVGLGLAVADRIAAAFAGRIQVSSEIGQGSCFTVRFPAADP
jgi:heavy metal sensor kinase